MPTLNMSALTKTQRDTLGVIAVGQDQGHHRRTLRALLERDLIVGRYETLPGHPPVRVIRWEVPTDVHIQWCEWCATQLDEGGSD